MILRLDEISDLCKIASQFAVANSINTVSNLIQIKSTGTETSLHISDGYHDFMFYLPAVQETFNATIESKFFLNLIPRITSETIELTVEDQFLYIKGSGSYKIPLVFDNGELMEIPELTIQNVTNEFTSKGDDLYSVLKNNTKQLTLGVILNPLQRLFYLDGEGAITFTTGACVNKFNLGADVKMLLPDTVVKSFSLFKGEDVQMKFGYNSANDDFTQPVLSMSDGKIKSTHVLSFDDESLHNIPVTPIRELAFNTYDHRTVLNCTMVSDALNRISVFLNDALVPYIDVKIEGNILTLITPSGDGKEEIVISENFPQSIDMMLDAKDLRAVFNSASTSGYVTMLFNDEGENIVLADSNVYNVIPLIEE